ncbi:MAG: histidinol dehydrogenase [Robiginitomaculum sp.]
MQVLNWSDLNGTERKAALARPDALIGADVGQSVTAILADVKARGDAALRAYTANFDGVDSVDMRVPVRDLKAAWDALNPDDKAAMELAKANITAFHTAQIPATIAVDVMDGVSLRREPRALNCVGLYVPGGTAPLVSTMMMLAIPASIAGVKRRVVTTPPPINDAILAAAYLCGVDEVYAVGGAQAIGALAYGTDTIPKVSKIFGPGNAYVATAKAMVSAAPGGPAIDLPAGPSEAMVYADDEASPVFVAADLLSQAEHDVMAQTVAIVRSQSFANKLLTEIERQITDLPRADIARAALSSGRILIASDDEQALSIINAYAPEHLILQTENAADLVASVREAGSVFVGPWTPESVGDYASGTNHTLPTYGAARAYSGVTTESFYTFISVQTLTRKGLEALGPAVERLANMEGLEAHRRAVSLRLESKTS